jgi:multidrug efflux system outer membrane protein
VSARRLAWLAPFVPLLFACTTVGPDYRVPGNAAIRSASANGALLGGNNKAVAIAPLPDAWWRL